MQCSRLWNGDQLVAVGPSDYSRVFPWQQQLNRKGDTLGGNHRFDPLFVVIDDAKMQENCNCIDVRSRWSHWSMWNNTHSLTKWSLSPLPSSSPPTHTFDINIIIPHEHQRVDLEAIEESSTFKRGGGGAAARLSSPPPPTTTPAAKDYINATNSSKRKRLNWSFKPFFLVCVECARCLLHLTFVYTITKSFFKQKIKLNNKGRS